MDTSVSYSCVHCGEAVTVPVDASGGGRQEYVEDCQVCCRPNVLEIRFDERGRVTVSVREE